jgi:hypothetical protein
MRTQSDSNKMKKNSISNETLTSNEESYTYSVILGKRSSDNDEDSSLDQSTSNNRDHDNN